MSRKQKNLVNLTVLIIVAGLAAYLILRQPASSPQLTQNLLRVPPEKQIKTTKPDAAAPDNINFSILYPPTPSSFGCNPYAGTYTTQQGKVIQTYDQWKDLYGELLKNCYTKTDAPQIIDFNKQTMISVFAGSSCTATKIDVETISPKSNKIVVHSVVTVGGCALPSFSFPFTLIAIDKSNLPAEFTFESVKYPSEPF